MMVICPLLLNLHNNFEFCMNICIVILSVVALDIYRDIDCNAHKDSLEVVMRAISFCPFQHINDQSGGNVKDNLPTA